MSRKKYKFRFADMMPNAWFYKLKNNSSSSSHHPIIIKNHHHQLFSTISSPNHPTIITQSAARTSYYYTRQQVPTFIPDHNPPPPILHTSPTNPKPSEETHSHPDDEPPRKSFEKTRSTKRRTTTSSPFSSPSSSSSSSSFLVASSVSDGCSFRSTLESVSTKSNSTPDYSGSCSSPSSSSVADENSNKKIDVFDCLSELGQLPQIVTKPDKFSLKKTKETTEPTKIRTTSSAKSVEKNVDHGSLSVKIVQQDRVKKPGTLPRRSFHSSNSPGLKLRSNSPRIVTRKSNTIQARRRKMITTTTTTKQSRISSSERRKKNHSDSFAIIKSSYNPQEDFRESMEEMIIENNLTTSSDLEELLASYLSLNSDEYHDIIVKVFRHVWFDLIDNS